MSIVLHKKDFKSQETLKQLDMKFLGNKRDSIVNVDEIMGYEMINFIKKEPKRTKIYDREDFEVFGVSKRKAAFSGRFEDFEVDEELYNNNLEGFIGANLDSWSICDRLKEII